MVAPYPHISHNYGMDIEANIPRFLDELTQYVGTEYLQAKSLNIDLETRFDQLNYDLVDEVITEHIVSVTLSIDDFMLDDFPETVGELLEIVKARHA